MTLDDMKREIHNAYENDTQLYVQFNGFKVPVIVTGIDRRTVGVHETYYCAEFAMLGHPVVDAPCQDNAIAQQRDELRDALVGLMNDIGGGKKACGHDFTCICAMDKARAALKGA